MYRLTNNINMPRFPEHYPETCPPTDAIDASGEVYRITQGVVLLNSDFHSYHDMGKPSTACECSKRGISLFDSLENAKHRQRLTPRLGKAISRGTIVADSGKMKLTRVQSGHIEWWVYDGVDSKSYFAEGVLCQT